LSVTQIGLDSLYEQNGGRVFAYCYARVGSRDVAEWAVNATFDRARAALADGGIDEPELDWLLRTADKFCAPKLCLDARLESMLVLQDWHGYSFDEIAIDLEARFARLEEERSRLTPWRRILSGFNLGPAIAWVRGLFGGLSAVKATATAIALFGAIGLVATPLAAKLHHAVRPASHEPPPAQSPADSSVLTPGSGGTAQPGRAQANAPAAQVGGGAVTTKAHKAAKRRGKVTTSVGSASTQSTGAFSSQGQASETAASGAASRSTRHRLSDRAGVSASASASATTTTAEAPQLPNLPGVTLPGVSLPQTPSLPTGTLPTVPDTPTLPSVPETPTVPSVSTPSVPPVPTTPSVPGVTVPTVPSPPVAPPTNPIPPGHPGTPTVTSPHLP
jgi:hypothetical protein